MAFILTTTSLTDTLYTWMNRTTNDARFTSLIPLFIEWAIQRIKRDYPTTLQVEKYVTSTFSDGVAVYLKPIDWKENLAFSYGGGGNGNSKTLLLKRTLDFCYAYWPDQTQTSAPKFYANYGEKGFFIAPTPDAAYDIEVIYSGLPLALDQHNQTNIFTDETPRILFYATVHEAAIYVGNDWMKNSSEEEYQKELAAIKNEDGQQITDRQDDVRKG